MSGTEPGTVVVGCRADVACKRAGLGGRGVSVTIGRSLLLLGMAAVLTLTGCWPKSPEAGIEPPKSGTREPVIRVELAGPVEAVSLACSSPFNVKNDQGQVVNSGSSLPASTVVLNGGLVALGGKTLSIGRYLELSPQTNGAIRVNQHAYRGAIRLHPVGLDRLIVVNHVLMEDYLKGVLRGEMPRQFGFEAYKAQAVAARTFALYEMYSKRGGQLYDVHCTEASQVYLGADAESDKAVLAVEKTSGVVVTGPTKRGYRIFPTYFSSTCGGKTQGGRHLAAVDPEFEPLKGGIECPYCRISPRRTWAEKRIPLDVVRNKINDKMNERIGQIRQIRAAAVVNDRITMVAVTDMNGRTLQIAGEKFRLIVGPREMASTMCKIRVEGTMLVMTDGRGLGHGVGMCQWGAEGMSRQGLTAIQILRHYYPNCKLMRVY